MDMAAYASTGSVGLVNKDNTPTAIERAKNFGCDAAGRVYRVIFCVSDKIKGLFIGVLDVTCRIGGSPEAMQNAVKLAMFSIMAHAVRVGQTVGDCGKKVIDSLGKVDDFVDFTAIFRDATYFINGKHRTDIAEGHKFTFFGKACLLVADVAGCGLWLADAGAVNLCKLANSVGRLPICSFVHKVTLLTFTRAIAAVGISFLAVDALVRIGHSEQVTKNLLTLSNCVAEIAFKVFLIAGCINPVAHVTLGLVAASTGIAAFVYGEYYSAEEAVAV